jgi:hypothetical protein
MTTTGRRFVQSLPAFAVVLPAVIDAHGEQKCNSGLEHPMNHEQNLVTTNRMET